MFRSCRSPEESGTTSPRKTIVIRNVPLNASRDTTFTASATGDSSGGGGDDDDADDDDDDDNEDDNCNDDWPVALNGNKC